MKICLIELMPFPYTKGGGTTHIKNLGKSLVESGHEVYVVSSKPSKEYEKIEYDNRINVYNIGITHKMFKGGIFYYFYRLIFELIFVLSAIKTLNKIKPDVIDCQSPITTSLPASFSKFPFVITCHGIHQEGFEKLYSAKKESFVSKYLNKIYIEIAKFNIKRAKKIISQGDKTLNFYSELVNDKTKRVLVNNLVDIEFWQPSNNKKDDKLIISVARFTKQKALDKLILAMRELKDYNLIIVGEGELEQELKSIAGKNVKFVGFKNPIECLEYYRKARFTILPSEFEGLPYVILESMSCEVIPITTKVGELPELIKNGKNGFFLENNSPEEIVISLRKIEKLNLDNLSKEARKTIVEKYGLKNVCKQFLKTYKSIL
jgi:glycosyltransferase involved in cell wall biosynthesis